jgi:thiol-disulfide isomerase/thioredoxin
LEEFKKIEGITIYIESAQSLEPGDMFYPITDVLPIGSDTKSEIKTDGQILFVVFWDTFSPKSKELMDYYKVLLEKRGEDWKGKVRIIGLNINNDMETLKNLVTEKGWGEFEHYLRAGSNASQVYGVNRVPTVMLIDRDGKIAFKSDPEDSENLE